MSEPIFPEVAIHEGSDYMSAMTYIRIPRDGEHYFVKIFNEQKTMGVTTSREKIAFMGRFYSECYQRIICHLISKLDGAWVDSNKQTEEERIKEVYHF